MTEPTEAQIAEATRVVADDFSVRVAHKDSLMRNAIMYQQSILLLSLQRDVARLSDEVRTLRVEATMAQWELRLLAETGKKRE